MSAEPRNLSLHELQRSRRWPCDGVCRFTVAGAASLTYDQAYDAVLADSGSSQDKVAKKVTFTPQGFKRICTLNQRYFAVARQFISETLHAAALKLQQEQVNRAAEAAKNPTPAP